MHPPKFMVVMPK